MGRYDDYLDAIEFNLSKARKKGVINLSTGTNKIEKNIINVKENPVVNFGSCSYLGLEFDPRLRQSAIEAINKYGTQFSSSRAYMSIGLYEELESTLEQIFESSCLVASSTTLGHIGCIPVLVKDNDAVLYDYQVHNSVQTAITMLNPRGIKVEAIRHNSMEMLENAIVRLLTEHDHVWYMADGIYSMFGDVCPMEDIQRLLNKYKKFKVYIDDAHGMSWYGDKGKGYALSHLQPSEQVIVAVSLNKAFASGGSAIILPNNELKKRIMACGGTFLFSGPLQPPMLGAAIAAAKLHLQPEFKTMQRELWDNIKYTKSQIKELNLPTVSYSDTPVFFIGLSHYSLTSEVISQLLERGHYVNFGTYPAVSANKNGLRITITRLHTKEQIKALFYDIKEIIDEVISQFDFSYEKIYKAFRRQMKELKFEETASIVPVNTDVKTKKLQVCRYSKIEEVDQKLWDKYLGGANLVNYDTLKLLETSFSNNLKKEDNWSFEYFIIKDELQHPVLMTYTSISLNKDDMLSDREKSADIEAIRKHNPYFLTSEILSIGTPITEGTQMYIDREHPEWKKALNLLIEILYQKQEELDINQIVVRDFEHADPELESIFVNSGFLKFSLLNNNHISNFEWNDFTSFKKLLTKKSRKNFNADVLPNIDKFTFKKVEHFDEEQLKYWYDLYLNIGQTSTLVNTFNLPFKLFKNIANDPDWTIFELHPKEAFLIAPNDIRAAAVGFVQTNGATANFALIGLNYEYNTQYRVYLCMIYYVAQWAKETNKKRLNLGYTADREKKKLGAKQTAVHSFVHTKDEFNLQAIEMGAYQKQLG